MAAIHSSDNLLLIELNDWQLSVSHADGNVLATESAAAALTSAGLIFGTPALTSARSEPQRFNNRYLTSVNADPLGTDMGIAKNSADLLYHHLLSLQLPDAPALVAVPAHYSNDQLGLLLGIMNEASINVCGFVDIPIVHGLNLDLPDSCQVLDIEWHRFSLSTLVNDGGEYRLAGTTSLEHIGGVAALIDRWMNVIADDFIKKTRFDPLHNGITEQMVYDQVASWLDQRALRDQRIIISQSDTVREHEVSASLLKNRLNEQLTQLDLGTKDEPLLLTHRLANIPGVLDCLAEQGFTILESTRQGVLQNYRVIANRLQGDGITRITSAASVPSGTTATSAQRARPPASNTASADTREVTEVPTQTQRATHLLAQYRAFGFSDPRFEAYFDQTGSIIHADVALNGRNAIGERAKPGDELKIDGRRYIAIRIE